MNKDIINEISKELGISTKQTSTVLELLSEKNTVPFIARYRKEATGNLDEEQIKSISDVYEYELGLLERKQAVIRLIDERGMLNPELEKEILKATKLVEVEDLYRPFKEKKKTLATEAIKLGLEPLAKLILEFPTAGNFDDLAKPFLTEQVKTVEEALTKAGHIISEIVSDNANYRKYIRNQVFSDGLISSSLRRNNAPDDRKVYEIYYEYSEPVKEIKPHRVLALNRGEKEKVLSVKIDFDNEIVIDWLASKMIKDNSSFVVMKVLDSIIDGYNRLIFPSIEREIRRELTEASEIVAVNNFADNLENLLLTPPMRDKVVLALDPAFRTGCKLAVLDETGKYLSIDVIYPHEPRLDLAGSNKKMLELINKYEVEIIAIGNGTASRESETFVANLIKDNNLSVSYIIVNEAGASVYSASKEAIKEFPKLEVQERSAISIGRRLQDPLAELVKIDPKSIGVGLYQHDISNKLLTDSLNFVVEKSVNMVGVNINTASTELLAHVSGLNKPSITKIINLRDKKGRINSRNDLIDSKVLTPRIYEQAVGFLRIVDGDNLLDQTGIHPESYDLTKKFLELLDFDINDLGTKDLNDKLNEINITDYVSKLETDIYTLTDIVSILKKPTRDPRDEMDSPILKSDILKLTDLEEGMKLQGTVRNVVDFGVFIDIGLDNDGMAHISKLAKRFISHPSDVVSVGDVVDVYVFSIDKDKGRVALSLIKD